MCSHIFAQLHAVWLCVRACGRACDSICPCLNKCMLFEITLHKCQCRVHQKAHCFPPRPFHLPGEIAYPLNLCTRCSIQTKLPFVHKDATRRCMKSISGFITLSDNSHTRPLLLSSPVFFFFPSSLISVLMSCGGDETRGRKEVCRCRLDATVYSWDGRGWRWDNSSTVGGTRTGSFCSASRGLWGVNRDN